MRKPFAASALPVLAPDELDEYQPIARYAKPGMYNVDKEQERKIKKLRTGAYVGAVDALEFYERGLGQLPVTVVARPTVLARSLLGSAQS